MITDGGAIMWTISLNLHSVDGVPLLDAQDIYKYVSENSTEDVEFALYVTKWCELLNNEVLCNSQQAFGNTDAIRLGGWIEGYEYAKGYSHTLRALGNSQYGIELRTDRFKVLLTKPQREKGKEIDNEETDRTDKDYTV